MVSVVDFDLMIKRLERFGKSGLLPKPMRAKSGEFPSQSDTLERFADEQARALNSVVDALSLVMRHLREGPDWSKAFKISYATVDSNNEEVIVHNLGYIPNHFVMVRHANGFVGGAAPPTNFGDLRLVNASDKTATFQLSKGAKNQSAVFKVVLFRGLFIPPGTS